MSSKTITIKLSFKLGEGRTVREFMDAADHELMNLMEDYGDDTGTVVITEIPN